MYNVDGIQTIIYQVYIDDAANGYAVGRILKSDLTKEVTYIAKKENKFAHGKTLQEAVEAVNAKVIASKSVEERIQLFVEAFPMIDTFVKGEELFRWHNILTGSCMQGRKMFCQEKKINLEHEFTIAEFITLTINAYGGGVIKQLREIYKSCKK